MTKPKTPQRKYPRVQVHFTKPSMTKQSFKDECNINKIMEKFQKSGAISHYAKHAPTYGDATHTELHDALNIVADANTMFEELPSSIRAKFQNNPEQFLEFVQDPKNLAEMRELGLADKAPAKTTEVANVEQPATTPVETPATAES
nr:MAG: internal scaffolding protein [Microvirus sp.]